MESRPPAIFIMGPTASGKTDLAIELAKIFPVELISVDSALIYKGMDIGTAKPEPSVLERFPHRLVDICEPVESYSAARFCADAAEAMQEISSRGKIPLLVGGTMMYFHALQHGLSALPSSDAAIRAELQQRLESQGIQALHSQLKQVDPRSAERIHCNDTQRILRALEVFLQTGQPLSALQTRPVAYELPYQVIKLIRAPDDRALLHRRIAARFENMLAQGFEEEVRGLLSLPGVHEQLPAMRAVGYRQMIDYLYGRDDYDDMKEKGIIATRQLAKRQFTWLRREQNTRWLDESGDVLSQAVEIIGQYIE